MLYVYTIQRRSDPQSTWKSYFTAASRCQQQIHALRGQKDSLAQRYSIVLEELRIEASKQTDTAVKTAHASAMDASITQNSSNDERNNTRSEHNSNAAAARQVGRNMNEVTQNASFAQAPISSNVSQSITHPQYTTTAASFNLIDQAESSYDMQGLVFPTSMSDDSPLSMMDNWTGWGDFDSFVTCGIIGPGDSQNLFGGTPTMESTLQGVEVQKDGGLGGWDLEYR